MIKKTVSKLLDLFGIHNFVNKVRFFIPTLRKRRMLHSHGLKSLTILKEVFEKNESFFWLEFGTLLGAFRDKAFISHDYDIDLGILSEKRIQDLDKIIEPLGFIKTRELFIPGKGIIEETYVYNGTHIDFLYFYEEEDNLICYLFSTAKVEYWRDVIDSIGMISISYTFKKSGFRSFKFYNEWFYIPEDSDLHLRECYGDYNIVVKNWNDDQALNRKETEIRCFFKDRQLL